MAKSKDGSELEHLRGLVRQQKSLIKQLRKQLKRSDQNEDNYEDLKDDLIDGIVNAIEDKSFSINNCPECRKGTVARENVGIRVLETCNNCDYRKFKKT